MKRRIKLLLSIILISRLFVINGYAKPDWPSNTGIEAEAGIVIDADSGAVIFGKGIHTPYPPASIVKILTALIVLENSKLEDMVTFSRDAIYAVEDGSGNKLNIAEGDQLSVEDCLYSLLLHSCNQAANALAEQIAGSRQEFVRMMNEKVAALGCKESHFDNPSGLNGETQYVTAYDMAMIARAAYSNETLLKISSAESRKIPPTANNPEGLTIYQEHRLVKTQDTASEFYYPAAVAGKTGYLLKAGNTLVTYAKKDEITLISVVLKGTSGQYFIDGKNLLEFGFNNFQTVSIAENESGYVQGDVPVEIGGKSYQPSDLEIEAGGVITLPKGAEFSQADKTLVTELSAGSPENAVALIQYSYSERKIGQAFLLLKSEAESGNAGGEGSKSSDSETSPSQAGEEESGEVGTTGEIPDTEEKGGIKKESSGTGISFKKMLFWGIGAIVGIVVGLAVFVVKKEKRELKAAQLRRERRRQRLKEDGAEEIFEQIMQEKRKKE